MPFNALSYYTHEHDHTLLLNKQTHNTFDARAQTQTYDPTNFY
jgi:hypothetical protein